MIENFQISNFKGFNEPLKIDIAPITLIFGPNSSGKSSIIDSLNLIKHSGPNDLQTYKENTIDLGRPEEILSRQNKKINSNINYRFKFRYSNIDQPKGPLIGEAKHISIKKNFKLNKAKFFENNSIDFFIEDDFLFSLEINKLKGKFHDYEASITKFTDDLKILNKLFYTYEYKGYNNEIYKKESRKIDFILDQRSIDKKKLEDEKKHNLKKIEEAEKKVDIVTKYVNLRTKLIASQFELNNKIESKK